MDNLQQWNYDLAYAKELIFFLLEYYWELMVIAIITVLAYTKQRKWGMVVGYLGFVFLGLLLAMLTFPSISHTGYQEQCYFLHLS